MITEGIECSVISFPGDVLKRVSPDERSISFFILKAWEILDRLSEGTSREMDNGIYVTKQSLNEFFKDWREFQIFRATLPDKQDIKRAYSGQDGIYVYEMQEGLLEDVFSDKETIELYRPRSPERFILDINHRMDFIG
jgi:tRNA pseudouridine-54 N-methylase